MQFGLLELRVKVDFALFGKVGQTRFPQILVTYCPSKKMTVISIP